MAQAHVVIGGNRLEPFVLDELKFGADVREFKNAAGGTSRSMDVLYKGAALQLVVPHSFTRFGWSIFEEPGKPPRITVGVDFKDVDPTLESVDYTGDDGVLKDSVAFLGTLQGIEQKFEAMVKARTREIFPALGFVKGVPVAVAPHELAAKIRPLITLSTDDTGKVTGAYPPRVNASVTQYTQVFKGTAEVAGSKATIPPESFVSGILKWGRCTFGLQDATFGPHLEWSQLRSERKRTVAKCLLPPEPAAAPDAEEGMEGAPGSYIGITRF